MQQFKEISQANESALATLHATHDEYKTSTESHIARLEVHSVLSDLRILLNFLLQSEQNMLQERLRSAQTEIAQLSEKHSELQRNVDSERTAWLSDKKTLEGTIFELSTSEKHSESDRSTWESEARQLEERAKVLSNVPLTFLC